MVEKVIEKVEVTEDNVEDIALAEWKKEQADKEGKTVDEITDPGNIEVIETKEEITEEDDTTDDDTPPDDTKSDDELLEAKEEDLSDDEGTKGKTQQETFEEVKEHFIDKDDFDNDWGCEFKTILSWRYHLQQIVLEEDKLQYLKRFLKMAKHLEFFKQKQLV